MLTSLIEMLELKNFRHMTTSHIVSDAMDVNYDVILFFKNYSYFVEVWSSILLISSKLRARWSKQPF